MLLRHLRYNDLFYVDKILSAMACRKTEWLNAPWACNAPPRASFREGKSGKKAACIVCHFRLQLTTTHQYEFKRLRF